jgi:hypothetical protein
MSDDTCSQPAAPPDAARLIKHQEQAGAPQARRRRYHAVTPLREPFGQPSNYSLTTQELSRHVRQLRRAGWLPWEILARFDWRSVA